MRATERLQLGCEGEEATMIRGEQLMAIVRGAEGQKRGSMEHRERREQADDEKSGKSESEIDKQADVWSRKEGGKWRRLI